MAIPFKRMGRKDPRKVDGVVKYHPQLVTQGQSVDLDKLAYTMKEKSSLSLGDIQSVLTNLVEAIRRCSTVNPSIFMILVYSAFPLPRGEWTRKMSVR